MTTVPTPWLITVTSLKQSCLKYACPTFSHYLPPNSIRCPLLCCLILLCCICSMRACFICGWPNFQVWSTRSAETDCVKAEWQTGTKAAPQAARGSSETLPAHSDSPLGNQPSLFVLLCLQSLKHKHIFNPAEPFQTWKESVCLSHCGCGMLSIQLHISLSVTYCQE